MNKNQTPPYKLSETDKPGILDLEGVTLDMERESLSQEQGALDREKSSYRQIFKATSLFGGVQVFQILIGIVRVKFVAILLGTTGVGIMGLLNAPVDLIISITGLGISFSAVRDISEAHGSDDKNRIAVAIKTLRRWSWFTGMLGAVVTISLAPLLSQWSFGNREYTWAFVWLSVTLLLHAISQGQRAILQGTRRLKDMAKAAVIGSALGLITSIPLYYWFGLKGIVPALIISSATLLFLSWYFSRRVEVEKIELTIKKTYTSGLNMAKLGISMTLAGFVASLSRYILNAFISNISGVDQVGLYNAGWGVVGQYTAVIFAAMATDYFPRLSAVQADNEKVKELVRQQAETAVLIMTPLLGLLIIAMPMVVRILYTPAFMPMAMFASITLLGMQFKAISWALGYVYLAKGNGRLFLILEIISGMLILGLNLFFYYFFGLNGLGISFILSYFSGIILAYSVLKWKYDFSFPPKFYGKLFIAYGFVVATFLTVFISGAFYKYLAGILVLLGATVFSFIKLNELMDLRSFFSGIFKK
ncbi:MAG: O-antigen translocase [Bacteroidales bacterium]|nr:O-antigen translocase [Bacteroidales bacterium]